MQVVKIDIFKANLCDQNFYLPATFGILWDYLCPIKEHLEHKLNSIAICMRFRNIMGPADWPIIGELTVCVGYRIPHAYI